jgi:predicted glycogen debranching enzyme
VFIVKFAIFVKITKHYMSYIKFEKQQVVNLEFVLNREVLRANRGGAFACQTIIGCNTRKYHGLLAVEQPALDGQHHILLSSLDETIIQHGTAFNFGIHRYRGGHYSPKGNKYIHRFDVEPIPKIEYRVGGVVLTKELVFSSKSDQVLIRYTLVEAHSETILRLKPYLAFRNIHTLTKSNVDADTHYEPVPKGIRMKLYNGYTHLYLQLSKQAEYIHTPDWYHDFEYTEEINRGYEAYEDLLVPGYFEVSIKKGESILVSAGTQEIDPTTLKKAFATELKYRIPRNCFENNLRNAAQQFFVKQGKKTEIIAGYPWYDRIGRDTFMALPGLALVTGDFVLAKNVIDSMVAEIKGAFFPNIGSGIYANYHSADTSLWFFWALQQYSYFTNSNQDIWPSYSRTIKQILSAYKSGTDFGIKMLDNGLICCDDQGLALTWMNAYANGKPITGRYGCAVEVNALWYNAIMYSLEMATIAKDKDFIKEWKPIADKFPDVFKDTFWSKKMGYLCDVVNQGVQDWIVRPNMILATSLPFSPLSEKIRELILEKIKVELLTERGVRTLSPNDPRYKGAYQGNQFDRDEAFHQGTVFPWIFGHFVEGYLAVHKHSKLSMIKRYYEGFEETIMDHGLGTISELFDGDPPHKPGGAISQAISVAELLRAKFIIQKYESESPRI